MDRVLCSIDLAIAGSLRAVPSRRAVRLAAAQHAAGASARLSARPTCALSAHIQAAQLRRSGARGHVVVRAHSRGRGNNNSNEGQGKEGADAGLSVNVPDGYVRACVDNIVEQTVQGPCVMLRVLDGGATTRVVPVFIGVSECNSLLSAVKKHPHSRPLTHDLMKNCFDTLDYKVSMVQVTHLRDGTFFGRIFLRKYLPATNEYDHRDVDARPSDAINVAVRVGAPIFINKDVVATSSYEVESSGNHTYVASSPKKVKKLDSAIAIRMQLAVAVAQQRYDDAMSLSKMIAAMTGHDEGSGLLILQMEQAVREERYTDAAKLRDMLAQLNVEVQD